MGGRRGGNEGGKKKYSAVGRRRCSAEAANSEKLKKKKKKTEAEAEPERQRETQGFRGRH